MKKVIVFILNLFIIFCFSNVYALENDEDVILTNYQYQRLENVFGKEKINEVSHSFFNEVKDMDLIKNKEETQYIEQKSYYYGSQKTIITKLISEEEFNNVDENDTNIRGNCSSNVPGNGNNWCWETTYKKLTIILYSVSNPSTYECVMTLDLNWKLMPSVRSNDVMGMRGYNFTFQSGSGVLELSYTKNSTNYGQQYTLFNDDFYQNTGTGVSFGFPLPSGNNVTKISAHMIAVGNINNIYNSKVYGTYQHAQSTVSLSDAMNHSYSSSGLGGVISFNNSNISSAYDGMQGVNVTVAEY